MPIIGQVFSQYSQSAIKKTLECGYKFAPQEVEDILESLGFVSGSEVFMETLSRYNGSSTNQVTQSLLLCIFRAVSSLFR